MLLDYQNVFLEGALATSGTGNFLGPGSYDAWGGQTSAPVDALGNTLNIDPGTADGRNKQLLIQATTALTSGSSTGTVQFDLVMADDAALATNLVVVATTSAIIVTTAVKGYIWGIGVIPPGLTKRYFGVRYRVGTEALTAGAVFAGLVEAGQFAIPVT